MYVYIADNATLVMMDKKNGAVSSVLIALYLSSAWFQPFNTFIDGHDVRNIIHKEIDGEEVN